jgi:hypothetical protein
MAGPIRSSFVNIAKNAAASAASGFVSGVASSLRSGLGGSSASSASSPLQTSFNAKAKPILMYPAGLGTDGRNLNYIMFTPKEAKAVKLKKNLGSHRKALFAENRDTFTRQEVQEAMAKDKAAMLMRETGGTSSIYEGSRVFTTTKSQRTIALYMPPQLNVSYGMDYAESEISGASEILYGIFKDYQSTGSFDNTIKDLASGPAPEVLKGMAAKMVSGIPGLGGARDLYHMERGAIQTPKMELMFRGVGRREFSFSFTFLPESKTDGLDVQNIIREFKMGMHPEFDPNAGSRKQTIPDIFEIAYHHTSGPNNNLHRIGKCFLKKMDVTYGGDQFQTFKSDGDDMDGAPVRTTITLNFGEISLIDKNMVSKRVGGY